MRATSVLFVLCVAAVAVAGQAEASTPIVLWHGMVGCRGRVGQQTRRAASSGVQCVWRRRLPPVARPAAPGLCAQTHLLPATTQPVPSTHNDAAAPARRPLSPPTPCLLFADAHPCLALSPPSRSPPTTPRRCTARATHAATRLAWAASRSCSRSGSPTSMSSGPLWALLLPLPLPPPSPNSGSRLLIPCTAAAAWRLARTFSRTRPLALLAT